MAMHVLIHEVCLHVLPLYKAIENFYPNDKKSVLNTFTNLISLNADEQHHVAYTNNNIEFDISNDIMHHHTNFNELGILIFKKTLKEVMDSAYILNSNKDINERKSTPLFIIDSKKIFNIFCEEMNNKLPNNSMYNILVTIYLLLKKYYYEKYENTTIDNLYNYFIKTTNEFPYVMVSCDNFEKEKLFEK